MVSSYINVGMCCFEVVNNHKISEVMGHLCYIIRKTFKISWNDRFTQIIKNNLSKDKRHKTPVLETLSYQKEVQSPYQPIIKSCDLNVIQNKSN